MKKTDKKEREIQKLVLSKETIRLLTGHEMAGVAGGRPALCATEDSAAQYTTGTRATCSCVHATTCTTWIAD